jgi:hypothetical protein
MRNDRLVYYPNADAAGGILDPGADGVMQALDQEYTLLLRQHEAFDKQSNEQHATGPWTHDAERMWLAQVNPLRDRMFEIALEIIDIPARTDQDLRTKAKVLHELANGETGDVVHRLATALCADILHLKPH